MEDKTLCKHKRFVKWFPQTALPVYRKDDNGINVQAGYLKEIVFYGCLDCGKVIVKDYAA